MFDHCSLSGCHAAILADTENWEHPVCIGHFEVLDEPRTEPAWHNLHTQLVRSPKMFSYKNTTQGPVKVV